MADFPPRTLCFTSSGQQRIVGWLSLILLIVLALGWSGLADAEIYRWTDANGKLHFSDEPPADASKAATVQLKPMSEYQTPEQYKQSMDFAGETAVSGQSRATKARKLEQEQKKEAVRAAKCERYRVQHRVASYKIYSNTKAALDGSRRQQQLRNKIIEYCH